MIHGGNVWDGDPALWLDLSANVRPGGPPGWVREALHGAVDAAEFYPQLSLRRAGEALADYLGTDPGCVLPTAGGISAITLAASLRLSEAVVPAPTFTEYRAMLSRAGIPALIPSLLGEDHAVRSPAMLPELSEGRRRCLWVCQPSNPLGMGRKPEELLAAAERLAERDGFLVVDEAFIAYAPELSLQPWIGKRKNLIITGSMTKILGIPGVRLGYLCAAPEIVEELRRRQTPWEISCFAEAVALALPEHRQDVLDEGERNRVRRERLRAGLEALGIFVYPSDANFLLADFGRDVRPLEEALRRRGILVRSCMDFEGIDDGRHLRLAVKDEAASDRLLMALKEEWA